MSGQGKVSVTHKGFAIQSKTKTVTRKTSSSSRPNRQPKPTRHVQFEDDDGPRELGEDNKQGSTSWNLFGKIKSYIGGTIPWLLSGTSVLGRRRGRADSARDSEERSEDSVETSSSQIHERRTKTTTNGLAASHRIPAAQAEERESAPPKRRRPNPAGTTVPEDEDTEMKSAAPAPAPPAVSRRPARPAVSAEVKEDVLPLSSFPKPSGVPRGSANGRLAGPSSSSLSSSRKRQLGDAEPIESAAMPTPLSVSSAARTRPFDPASRSSFPSATPAPQPHSLTIQPSDTLTHSTESAYPSGDSAFPTLDERLARDELPTVQRVLKRQRPNTGADSSFTVDSVNSSMINGVANTPAPSSSPFKLNFSAATPKYSSLSGSLPASEAAQQILKALNSFTSPLIDAHRMRAPAPSPTPLFSGISRYKVLRDKNEAHRRALSRANRTLNSSITEESSAPYSAEASAADGLTSFSQAPPVKSLPRGTANTFVQSASDVYNDGPSKAPAATPAPAKSPAPTTTPYRSGKAEAIDYGQMEFGFKGSAQSSAASPPSAQTPAAFSSFNFEAVKVIKDKDSTIASIATNFEAKKDVEIIPTDRSDYGKQKRHLGSNRTNELKRKKDLPKKAAASSDDVESGGWAGGDDGAEGDDGDYHEDEQDDEVQEIPAPAASSKKSKPSAAASSSASFASAPASGSLFAAPAFGSTTSSGFGASSGFPTTFGSSTTSSKDKEKDAPSSAFGSGTSKDKEKDSAAPVSAFGFGTAGSSSSSSPPPVTAAFGTSFGTTSFGVPKTPAAETKSKPAAPAAPAAASGICPVCQNDLEDMDHTYCKEDDDGNKDDEEEDTPAPAASKPASSSAFPGFGITKTIDLDKAADSPFGAAPVRSNAIKLTFDKPSDKPAEKAAPPAQKEKPAPAPAPAQGSTIGPDGNCTVCFMGADDADHTSCAQDDNDGSDKDDDDGEAASAKKSKPAASVSLFGATPAGSTSFSLLNSGDAAKPFSFGDTSAFGSSKPAADTGFPLTGAAPVFGGLGGTSFLSSDATKKVFDGGFSFSNVSASSSSGADSSSSSAAPAAAAASAAPAAISFGDSSSKFPAVEDKPTMIHGVPVPDFNTPPTKIKRPGAADSAAPKPSDSTPAPAPFSFGAASSKADEKTDALPATAPLFGATPSVDKSAAPAFGGFGAFGAAAATPAPAAAAAKPFDSSAFGGFTDTSKSQAPAATPSSGVFGGFTSTATAAPSAVPTFEQPKTDFGTFGNFGAAPKPADTAPSFSAPKVDNSMFSFTPTGSAAAPAPSAPAPTSSFFNVPAPSAAPSASAFGGFTNTAAPSPTAATPSFGSGGGFGGSFGGAAPASTFGAGPSNQPFGGAPAPATTPSFGGSAVPTFTAPSTPSFGGGSAFGGPPQATPQPAFGGPSAFGGAPQQFGGATGAFGAPPAQPQGFGAPGAFGAPPGAPGAFGAPAPGAFNPGAAFTMPGGAGGFAAGVSKTASSGRVIYKPKKKN